MCPHPKYREALSMLGSGSVVACVCMLGTGEAESTLGARETVSVHTGMWPRAGCREHHP